MRAKILFAIVFISMWAILLFSLTAKAEECLPPCKVEVEKSEDSSPEELSNLQRMLKIEQAIEDGTLDLLFPELELSEADKSERKR